MKNTYYKNACKIYLVQNKDENNKKLKLCLLLC